METEEVKRPEVAFYSWNENTPSSEMIHISGGQREKDSNGQIRATGMKVAHFIKGLFRTSDPEIIAGLRLLIKKGKNDISEDKEVYLKAVLDPKRQSARALVQRDEAEIALKEERRENSRLRQQLEEKARENKILKAKKVAAAPAA